MYPPALTILKETRDAAAKQLMEQKDKDKVRQLFDDLLSIDEKLGDEVRTLDMFVRLDKEEPEVARSVYDIAQSTLVKAKMFPLCGKYMEPEREYAHWVELRGLDIQLADEESSSARKQEERGFAEKRFLERASTLIALLVLNERKPEAEKLAEDARSISKDPDRDAVVDAALRGNVPDQHFE
jgi:hypothetical protein